MKWEITKKLDNGKLIPIWEGFASEADAMKMWTDLQLEKEAAVYSVRETPVKLTEDKATNPKDHLATTRVPLWLLSPVAKAHWALGQLAGLIKYGAWNWREAGVRASVYLSAMQRHIDAWESGEEFDPVDGTHHLGNVMACAAILLDAAEAKKLVDDRPPSVSIRKVYRWAEELAAKLFDQYKDKQPRHYTIADTRAGGAT